jgi:hypothetical protein
MAPSRTDEILEGWKMVSHAARQPAFAPQPVTNRSSLPFGLLAASAVVILALVVGSRMLSSGPGPVLPGVGASPSAPVATPTATPSAAPTVAPSVGPSAVPSAAPSGGSVTGSPTAAEVAAAKAFVETYTANLKGGDTAGAWAMLAPEEQAKTNDQAGFASERRAYFQGVDRYTVTANPTDVQPIQDWLTGTNGATIDLAHAVLVEVQYNGAPTPADWELFIVAPRAGGGLEIFNVR